MRSSRLINPRGRKLYNTAKCSQNWYDFIFPWQPDYSPRKLPNLIDFVDSKNVDRNLVFAETRTYISSDHSPTIKNLLKSKLISKINLLKYNKFISSRIRTVREQKSKHVIDKEVLLFNSMLARQKTPLKAEKIISNSEIELLVRNKRRLRDE